MKHRHLIKLLSAAAIVGCMGAYMPAASAALSGKCGILVNQTHEFSNPPVGQVLTMDVLAVVDFTAGTISGQVTNLTINTSGNTISQSAVSATSITVGAGPSTLPGSSTLSFTTGSGNMVSFNLLPVNSGNTILVQGANVKFTGVCQML